MIVFNYDCEKKVSNYDDICGIGQCRKNFSTLEIIFCVFMVGNYSCEPGTYTPQGYTRKESSLSGLECEKLIRSFSRKLKNWD